MGSIILGLVIPFLGTVGGASIVFFMKNRIHERIENVLLGFAAGVMFAASIWSLIMPSINMSTSLGKWSFIPAAVGFLLGIGFLLLLDSLIPHLHVHSDEPEGVKAKIKRSTMLIFAVTLHNIPEGMAVGVVLAGAYYGNSLLTVSGAIALSIGIAIQNFPEGAIISLPIESERVNKYKSFCYGVMSGVVEPIAAIITILLIKYIEPILPYLLSFAAGAMIYVVVEELIPQAQSKKHSNWATVALSLGFVLMMILDVAFS